MEEWFELMTLEAGRQELKRVLECNQETSKYGLSLTEEEARELMACRKETLRESRRVEFAAGILPELIKEFCDSQFIQSGEYVDTLARLQEIFYLYKNESMDELTDGELLEIMKENFEQICYGDLEYLETTCLERFAAAVRAGYETEFQKKERDEYTLKKSGNEYEKFSEETRWEFELYRIKLEESE